MRAEARLVGRGGDWELDLLPDADGALLLEKDL